MTPTVRLKLRPLLIKVVLLVVPFLLLEGGLRGLEFGFHFLASKSQQEKLIQGNKLWQHELFSRFRGVHQSDPLLLWKFKANVPGSLLRTNNDGLLGSDIAVAKPPGTFRILLLGDSTPVGLGLKQREHAFGEQLVELLNQRDPGTTYELVNAAVSGYTSLQGLVYLRNFGLKYSPDLIITYFGNNDASMSGFISDKELVYRNKPLAGFLGLLQHLATYRLMEKLLVPVMSRIDDGRLEEKEVVIRVQPEDYFRNLEGMIQFAREHGIDMAMVNVPVPLEWPAGLQFKLFSDMTTLQGELVMSDQTQKLLQRKIAYALDWEVFSRRYHQITKYSISVFQSAYEDQGDFQTNRAFYEEELISEPDNHAYLNNLGVLFWKEGRFAEAGDYFRKAISGDSSYAVFHFNLGMLLKSEGRLEEAEAELELAKDLDYQSLRIKSTYKEQLRALSLQYDIPLVDAVSAFNSEGREFLFLDHCHPSRKGHWIIAEEIAKLLPGS